MSALWNKLANVKPLPAALRGRPMSLAPPVPYRWRGSCTQLPSPASRDALPVLPPAKTCSTPSPYHHHKTISNMPGWRFLDPMLPAPSTNRRSGDLSVPSGGRARLAGSGLRDCIAECSENGVITARPFLFSFETGTHLPSVCSPGAVSGRMGGRRSHTQTHTPRPQGELRPAPGSCRF